MQIYVRGYFYTNLGDDLFLHILARRYPTHQFHVVIQDKYSRSFNDESNIIVHKYKKWIRGIDKIIGFFNLSYNRLIERKCDLNVVISGSIFQELKNDKNAGSRLLRLPHQNKTYVLGVNFGPYITEKYYQMTKKYLSQAEDVCFRDHWSYDKFLDLHNTRVAPDIVFGIRNTAQALCFQNNSIFISVIDCSKKISTVKYADMYKKFIIKAIRDFIKNDYKIILAAFCVVEGDETAINEILESLTDKERKSVECLIYNGFNREELLKSIQNSKKAIATRFHSIILSMTFKIPVLPIIYNDKSRHFLDSIGLDNVGLRLDCLEDYQIENKDYITVDNITELVKESESHFAKLDRILHDANCNKESSR